MYGPEATGLDTYISPILTDFGVGYYERLMASGTYIADQIFRNIPVAAPTGVFNRWTTDDFLRIRMKQLANGESAPLASFSSDFGMYNTSNFGLGTSYTNQDLAKARQRGQSQAAFKQAKTMFVTLQGVLKLEQLTANLCRTAANWNFSLQGVPSNPDNVATTLQWDQDASDPIKMVSAWKRQIQLATGMMPNTAVIPGVAADIIVNNAALRARILGGATTNTPAIVTRDALSQLLGIPNIYFPEGVYNTADEMAPTASNPQSLSYLWGKDMWLGYVAPTDQVDAETPSAGYRFSWTGDTTAGLPAGVTGGPGPQADEFVQTDEGLWIRDYYLVQNKSQIIECELWTTPQVVAKDCGFVINNIVS